MKVGFLDMLILIGIIQGFLLGFVILVAKFFKSSQNQYLGYAILTASISSLNNWFWELSTFPFIIDLLDLILWQFLFPVMLVQFFTKASGYKLNIKEQWLYVPFLFFTIANIVICLDTQYDWYKLPIPSKRSTLTLFYKVLSISSVLLASILHFISFRAVFKYSSIDKEDINKWLKQLWLWITVLIVIWITIELIKVFYGKISTVVILAGLSLLVYWLIYKGLYQFKLANEQFEIQQILQGRKQINQANKPDNSTHQTYYEQLLSLLQTERVHHNPDLGRDDVATLLGISGGYLSQVIHASNDKSFTELINHFRIEDAKAMIQDSEFKHYSLISIGLEAGFKSKSNFYTSFKKATGLTPGMYKKSLEIDS